MAGARQTETLQWIYAHRCSLGKVVSTLRQVKVGTASGYDLVHPEFLKDRNWDAKRWPG